MKKSRVAFAETNQFSSLIDDYLSGKPALKPFYNFSSEIDAYEKVIESRRNFSCNRKQLAESLLSQYEFLNGNTDEGSLRVLSSIGLLENENTFTVTTGHQLNIFTGPLFSIYKIATTIKLARELKSKFSDYNFIPVFWMASEDHDLDEINHTKIFGKEVKWDKHAGGAVGRMDTVGMKEVLSGVSEILGTTNRGFELFEKAYLDSATLAEATRKIMHGLFSEYGLVVIDGDDASLKSLFIAEMRDELLGQKTFASVKLTTEKLSKLHKTLVQPREINLFYLAAGSRERIVRDDENNFRILNSERVFTESEILSELKNHPENFSPNVILRTMYQEKILPNLAYIAGPGELSYWLQFKDAFTSAGIFYPAVVLRNCFLIIEKSSASKLAKLGISVSELFKSTDFLILKVLENSSEIPISTNGITDFIQKAFHDLATSWEVLDASLVSSVEAEKQKTLKGISALEEKARRALKRKNELIVNQVKNLKEKLFPDGGLQERTENFLPYYCRAGKDFIREIVEHTDPFEKQFVVLEEETEAVQVENT